MFARKHNIDQNVFAELVDFGGRVVIDVGSGAGGFIGWLCEGGAKAYGVECSSYMLAQADSPSQRWRQVCGVGQHLPFASASASVVTFMNSLHHVPADVMHVALTEAIRVVGPGGHIYVLEPVAEGPGYETSKLIDDEAQVRKLAQESLDRFVGSSLESLYEGRYINRYVYRDVEAYIDVMIGADGSRAEQAEQHRVAIEEAFTRNGTPTTEGMAFEHPMHYRLFAT